MEFDFSRLSCRSFEQLTQEIALQLFGLGVVVFGDGADGGREATYDGVTSYAPHGSPWDGYVVTQAKFRQRPLGTEKDGPWAVDQLEDELAKFRDAADDRRRPEFYLFITNAVLSPGTGGTKDQAFAKLRQAQMDWDLKGFDVWDYDKLRTLLSSDERLGGVRAQYGWITAGDVLAAMLEHIQGATPEFERTIANYLQKTLVGDRFVRLEEAGHSAEEPTSLSRVFVDLPVVSNDEPSEQMFLRSLLEATAVTGGAAGLDRQRFVLVGGPGQGKTTLGQFASQIFRAGVLATRNPRLLSAEAREAVNSVERACEAANLPFGRVPRFPVRIVLSDLARSLADHEETLLSWIAGTISTLAGEEVPTSVMRAWLGAYPWFIVLDGLDEVPASAERDLIMRAIDGFWIDVAQEEADVFVLATTRPQGYNDDFSPDYYTHVELAELPASLALEYGDGLARARYGDESDRTTTVMRRLRQATGDSTTAHLMRSPLQVAIMTALVDRYGQPPHERWSLFDAYYHVIYQREREKDTQAAPILREYQPDVDAIHQRVGLALQILTTVQGHPDPRLSGDQLAKIVDARLQDEGHDVPTVSEGILRAAELRLVFLVGAEADRIGFEVRSLQEFMAAGALVDGPDEQVIERLRSIAASPSWRNVFLFAVGECFVHKQHLRPAIHNLCRELDVEASDPLGAASALGTRIAIDLLEDRTGRRQPKHRQLLATHALEGLDLMDETVATRVAACYEDDLREVFTFKLADGVSAGESHRRVNALRCLATLGVEGHAWAAKLLHEHPPATTDETYLFLRELPHSVVDRLERDFLSNCIHTLEEPAFVALARGGSLAMLAAELSWLDERQQRASVVTNAPDCHLALTLVERQPFSLTKVRQTTLDVAELGDVPAFVPLQEARRLVESPTAVTLADGLARIATESTPAAWTAVAFIVPWPLGLALNANRTAADLLAAAERARAGAFGDGPAWAEAETRWERSGWRPSDPESAFPLAVAGMRQSTERDVAAVPWLPAVRSLQATDPWARQNLARLLLWRLAIIYAYPGAGRATSAEIVELIQAAGDAARFVDVRVLDTADASCEAIAAICDALAPGVRLAMHAERQIRPGFVTLLSEAARRSPNPRTYEALAFGMADARELPQVHFEEQEAVLGDRRAGLCGAFVRLLNGVDEHTARQLGRRFGGITPDDSDLMHLLESEHAFRARHWEAFLVEVKRALAPASPLHLQLNRRLTEALSRRVTPLGDREVWSNLGLFDPHPLSLTVS